MRIAIGQIAEGESDLSSSSQIRPGLILGGWHFRYRHVEESRMKALSIRPRILFLRHRHQFGLWNKSMNSVVARYRAAGSLCGLNAILDQAPHAFNNAGQDAFNRLPPLRIGARSLGSCSQIGQVLAITIYNQPKSQMF